MKLCRGLKLGWSVDKSHGRVAWSTAQDLSGVGGASSILGLAFGVCSVRWIGGPGEGKASLDGKAIKPTLGPPFFVLLELEPLFSFPTYVL